MSQLSIEDVKKLADLAKIEVSEGEAENYLKDINNILGHLAMVTDADTSNSELQLRFYNSLRNDLLEERDFLRDLIFKNVQSLSGDNYVKVAKVIKK